MTMRINPLVAFRLPSGALSVPGTIVDVDLAFGTEVCGSGRAIDVDNLANPAGPSPANWGPITAAALSTTRGQIGGLYELSDGPNAGAKLTWAIPAGESSPTWCWWLWPQSAYTA